MAYVFVDSGIVKDRVGNDPHALFGAEYADRFIIAPDEVQIGWIEQEDGNFVAPEVPQQTVEEATGIFNRVRARKLNETDWWAVRASEPGGTPMTEEQLAYRAALRTINDADDFDPLNITWPEKPE